MSRVAPAGDRRQTKAWNHARHGIEWLAVAAGWTVAVAAAIPAIFAAAGPGERAATFLSLAAGLAWWIAVVVTIRSDLRHFIIPDGASLTTAALGLGVALGAPLLRGDGVAGAWEAGAAAAANGAGAFLIFWVIGAAFRWCGREALGFGDVKLAGAAATWLEPGAAAVALEVAALGAILILLLRRSGPLRETAMPFGAFLAPAAWLVFVLGPMFGDGTGLNS